MPANATLQLRRDPSSEWLVNNPILNAGEIGYETDTSLFKIGNGTLSWAALPYAGTSTAASGVVTNRGGGSDGNLTLSQGTVTLERDTFYNNVTLSGTGIINTGGYRLYIAGTLDITNAGVGAIQFNGH